MHISNDKPITLDDRFNDRQFNGVDNTDTQKLLLNEQYQNGTCHILCCLT